MNLPKRLALALALFPLLLVTLAPAASAQVVRPWLPSTTDSVVVLATLAKTRFQLVQGDSAGGRNLEGYQRVSEAAQMMLWRLGRQNTAQAAILETVLDSLGLDTDVRVDPQVPDLVFLMVRNPFKPSADAVAYLMWFIHGNLRSQGVVYPPNREPRFRAWFTGERDGPYEAAVLFQTRREPYGQHLHLYRALANGFGWGVMQFEKEGPDFGPPGDAQFVDVNDDGRPEIVSWTPVEPDSFVTLMGGVPRMQNEGLWVERPNGFVLQDARLLPSPIATFATFVRALVNRQRDQAARLLLDPAKVQEAFDRGWDRANRAGDWRVEYGEPDQAWPEWFEFRVREKAGDTRWIVHFTWRDGRWWIRDWIPVRQASTGGQPVTPHAETGKKR